MSVISDPKITTQKIRITNWHTRRQFSTWTCNKIGQYHVNDFEILKNIKEFRCLLLHGGHQEPNVTGLHNTDFEFLS